MADTAEPTYGELLACARTWERFITGLDRMMSSNCNVVQARAEPVMRITWRGEGFTHCPFCGRALAEDFYEKDRHP